MSRCISSHEFEVGCNEQLDACVMLQEEMRSVIFGTVLDPDGMPVRDAVVKLLEIKEGSCYPLPITHTFTDRYGQFLFGPLCPGRRYVLKVFKNNIKVRCEVLDPSDPGRRSCLKPAKCKPCVDNDADRNCGRQ